jgi:hypothetical protein
MTRALLSDAEFDRLIDGQPLVFAFRARAQSVAHELRQRAASVAAELRQLIVAGEVSDPLASAMIANSFDRLACAIDEELHEPKALRSAAPPPAVAGHEPEEYEREVWWTSPEAGFAGFSGSQEAA